MTAGRSVQARGEESRNEPLEAPLPGGGDILAGDSTMKGNELQVCDSFPKN